MKKFLCLVLVLSLLGCASASASFDLDSLDAYELFELQMEVQNKIFEIDESAGFFLYPGSSIVGKNFEAGTYIFKLVKPIENEFAFDPWITIWKSEDVMGSVLTADTIDHPSFDPDIKDFAYECSLTDGMCFKLNSGVFQVVKVK